MSGEYKMTAPGTGRQTPKGENRMNKIQTLTMASAAALFAMTAVAVVPAAAATGDVHCYGVNSCKGQSDCKSGNHSCKGQNSCKGQGWKKMSSDACTAAHGSTTAPTP
jgi:hypothetical protein